MEKNMKKLLLLSFAIVLLLCWDAALAGNTAPGESVAISSKGRSRQVDITSKDKTAPATRGEFRQTANRGNSPNASEKTSEIAAPESEVAPVIVSFPNRNSAFNTSNAAPKDYPIETKSKKDDGIPAPPPDPNVILQGGDTMGDATIIPAVPYTDSGTTAGYAHDFTLDCTYNLAPDVFYSYTPPADGWITVTVCSQIMDTVLGILDENGNQLACDDDFWWTESRIANFAVTAGSTYYIVVSGYGESNFGPYTLIVSGSIPCQIACPDPNTPENEPDCYNGYVDHTNGGCNSAPDVFGNVVSGETICGTAGTYLFNGQEYRDTDWYTLTLDSPKMVRINGMADFPFLIFVVQPPCPGTDLCYEIADPCAELNLTAGTLGPGEYWIIALPSVFTDVPCGSEYYFTVTAEDPPSPPPNDLCETATPITGPYPQTVFGTTIGATLDCPDNLGINGVWYSIDLPYDLNVVSVNFCPTTQQTRAIIDLFYYDCSDCGAYEWWFWSVQPCENGLIAPILHLRIPGPSTIYLPVYPGGFMDFGMTVDVQENISPPNDNCADVTPVPLNIGQPLQFTGDNTGATLDCPTHWYNEAWVAFTTTECMNITIDFCGTTPAFNDMYIILEDMCPCDDTQLYAYIWSNELCDNNWSATWAVVPAGTYYYPILSEVGALGPYVLNINGVPCDPPPANDNCVNAEVIGEVVNQTWSTLSATFDGPGACLFSPNIWYLYTASATAPVTVSLCGTLMDTKLAVYDGPSCPSDPELPEPAPLQGGENASSAVPIDDPLPVVYTGTTAGYIQDYTPGCGNGGPDVVYSYAPSTTGNIDIGLCGSTFFATLMLLDDTEAEIACSSDGCGVSMQPKLFGVGVEAGRTYYIVVNSFYGDSGPYTLTVLNTAFALLDCNDDFCDYQSEITFDATAGSQYLLEVGGYWTDVGEGVITINNGGCNYVIGDYNGSGTFNVADITDGFSKLKTGLPEPAQLCECPPGSGNFWAVAMDVNNSCSFNVADIISAFSKLKTGSPELIPCSQCPPEGRLIPDDGRPLVIPALKVKEKIIERVMVE